MIRWPEVIKPHQVNDTPVISMDFSDDPRYLAYLRKRNAMENRNTFIPQ